MQNINIVPLVSFPKSGNTWMRFLLANLFKKDRDTKIDFQNINDYMPTSPNESLAEISTLFIEETPVFIKEHYNYYDMPYDNFEKAIYIYRDGFDALYSYWHFMDAQAPGLYPNIKTFSRCYWKYCGHWGEHIYSWILDAKTQKKHNVLGISYERLTNEPINVLSEVVDFLELEVSRDRIEEAVHASDKKNMKKLSGSAEFMKSKKKDFHFVRSAKKGDSESNLPSFSKHTFMLNQLNYDLMLTYNYIEKENEWKNLVKDTDNSFFNKIMCTYFYFKYRIKDKRTK